MMIGTRGSALAMRQTEIFIEMMNRAHPAENCVIKEIKVLGDVDQTSQLHELQGFGAFVRELDDALIKRVIDVSVNSMKDMPIESKQDVVIPAILPRASAADVVIPIPLNEIPLGAVIGTSSLRRAATVKQIRPDLIVKPLRGNIQTRIRKWKDGEYDAIILAKAGLDRTGEDVPCAIIDVNEMVPAPAQGAIAVACRGDDIETIRKLSKLDDPKTRAEVTLEREIMKATGAGCTSPIGIYATLNGNDIQLRANSFIGVSPVRFFEVLPRDYSQEDVKRIASQLVGSS
jgi:porphobilinogen deaminase